MSFVDDWAYAAAPEDDEEPQAPDAWCMTDNRPASHDCEKRGHRVAYVDE